MTCVGAMTIETPRTKLWVCTNCGDLYELLKDARPPRGIYGEVLCTECAEHVGARDEQGMG